VQVRDQIHRKMHGQKSISSLTNSILTLFQIFGFKNIQNCKVKLKMMKNKI